MAYGGIGSTTLMQNRTKMTLLRVIPHQLTCMLAIFGISVVTLFAVPFDTRVCVYIFFRHFDWHVLAFYLVYIYIYILVYSYILLDICSDDFWYIYIYLGLQKINNFWSTPNVLLFWTLIQKVEVLVDISKNRSWALCPPLQPWIFCHSPTPWIDYRFRSWKKPGFKCSPTI